MIFGALIVFFRIVEPHGLAKLCITGAPKTARLALPALKAAQSSKPFLTTAPQSAATRHLAHL